MPVYAGAGEAYNAVSGAEQEPTWLGSDSRFTGVPSFTRRLGTRKADIFPAGVLSDEARSVTLQQLMGNVEGLEEQLFQAEARRHDAEVHFHLGVMALIVSMYLTNLYMQGDL